MAQGMKGRPSKDSDGFETLCESMESEGELYTLDELRTQLQLIKNSKDVYSTGSIKRKLQDKYGEDISFNGVRGRRNVVCLSNVAKHIINEMWYENRGVDPNNETERIVKTAAKLIVSEIINKTFDCEYYPDKGYIADVQKRIDWLTPNLKLFMELCARSSLQQASIRQCFTYVIRPRSTLPPMLFGLAVEIDHVFRSRWQVDYLSKLGHSLSSYEVTRYKQSVIENENASDWLKRMMLGSYCHWIADNVDHNVRTFGGKGTLHALGIIVTTTSPIVSNQDL